MKASETRKIALESLKGKWKQAFIITLVFTAIIFCLSFLEATYQNNTELSLIFSIIFIVLTVPLSYGFIVSMIKLKKNEKQSFLDYLKFSFYNFKRSWAIIGRTLQKMLLPIILLIIAVFILAYALVGLTKIGFFLAIAYKGLIMTSAVYNLLAIALVGFIVYLASIILFIPKFYLYALAYPLAIENPEMSAKDAVAKSAELMKGYRFKLFCLLLSFIGWFILVVIVYSILLNLIPILGIAFFFISYCLLLPYMMQTYIAFYEDRLKSKVEVIEKNP